MFGGLPRLPSVWHHLNLLTNVLLPPVHEDLLRIYYVPSTVLDARTTAVKKFRKILMLMKLTFQRGGQTIT